MEKQLKDYSGEELASILNSMYGQLIQAQNNIQAIQMELKRREEVNQTLAVKPKLKEGKV